MAIRRPPVQKKDICFTLVDGYPAGMDPQIAADTDIKYQAVGESSNGSFGTVFLVSRGAGTAHAESMALKVFGFGQDWTYEQRNDVAKEELEGWRAFDRYRFKGFLTPFGKNVELIYVTRLGETTPIYPALEMEYVKGVPLSQRIREKGISRQLMLEIYDRLLEYAVPFCRTHVHGDLKPENILITGAPLHGGDYFDLKIIDYHTVRPLYTSHRRDLIFTDAFSNSRDSVRNRQDVFALGVILELLFRGSSPEPHEDDTSDERAQRMRASAEYRDTPVDNMLIDLVRWVTNRELQRPTIDELQKRFSEIYRLYQSGQNIPLATNSTVSAKNSHTGSAPQADGTNRAGAAPFTMHVKKATPISAWLITFCLIAAATLYWIHMTSTSKPESGLPLGNEETVFQPEPSGILPDIATYYKQNNLNRVFAVANQRLNTTSFISAERHAEALYYRGLVYQDWGDNESAKRDWLELTNLYSRKMSSATYQTVYDARIKLEALQELAPQSSAATPVQKPLRQSDMRVSLPPGKWDTTQTQESTQNTDVPASVSEPDYGDHVLSPTPRDNMRLQSTVQTQTPVYNTVAPIIIVQPPGSYSPATPPVQYPTGGQGSAYTTSAPAPVIVPPSGSYSPAITGGQRAGITMSGAPIPAIAPPSDSDSPAISGGQRAGYTMSAPAPVVVPPPSSYSPTIKGLPTSVGNAVSNPVVLPKPSSYSDTFGTGGR